MSQKLPSSPSPPTPQDSADAESNGGDAEQEDGHSDNPVSNHLSSNESPQRHGLMILRFQSQNGIAKTQRRHQIIQLGVAHGQVVDVLPFLNFRPQAI